MSDTHDMQTDANAPGAPSAPGAPGTGDAPHPLDPLIASIRTAISTNASTEARAVGATACRSILTALEATSGQPLVAQPAPATPTPPASPIAGLLAQFASMPRDKQFELLKQLVTSPRSPVGGILSRLASLPREQLIALINEQLRALAPASAPVSPPAGPRFHMIPIPQAARRGGAP